VIKVYKSTFILQ